MISYEDFQNNLQVLQGRIAKACAESGRAEASVRLLPVTKTHPAEVLDYVSRAGLGSVGENRVQEAARKKTDSVTSVKWELIGHLQSNKAKQALAVFDRIQSVDRTKLVNVLSRLAEEEERVLPILLQVNAGDDPAKFGASREEANRLLEAALEARGIRVEGLMTIAPLGGSDIARRTFANLRETRDQLVKGFGQPLDELSMGMSSDLEEAILEGSTCIRVGSALFGAR